MKITVKCKLDPTVEQIEILNKTLDECLKAANFISAIAWKHKCFNRVKLHHLVYHPVKKKFKFTSQICCAIKDKVVFSYKKDKEKQHIFKQAILPLSFRRSLSFIDFKLASISTIVSRQKINLQLGDYQKINLTKATKLCNSELIKRNAKFYLHIPIEFPNKPKQEMKGIIGIDLGINNIATLSSGQNFSAQKLQSIKEKIFRLRQSLQSKGTRSAKRHLKKLSGREKRFQKDINYQISKQIVKIAQETKSIIALEDLKGIRKRMQYRKIRKRKFFNWAFNQLQEFIKYKAQQNGIPIIFIKPAYTSQICSSCGKLGDRSDAHFSCPSCKFVADADYNAARNIASRAAFNQPIVASIEAKGSNKRTDAAELSYNLR